MILKLSVPLRDNTFQDFRLLSGELYGWPADELFTNVLQLVSWEGFNESRDSRQKERSKANILIINYACVQC